MTATGLRMHQTHDEIVSLPMPRSDELMNFRIRIWLARERRPVVLLQEVPGDIPPSFFAVRLAHKVMAGFLSPLADQLHPAWYEARQTKTDPGPWRITLIRMHPASYYPFACPTDNIALVASSRRGLERRVGQSLDFDQIPLV